MNQPVLLYLKQGNGKVYWQVPPEGKPCGERLDTGCFCNARYRGQLAVPARHAGGVHGVGAASNENFMFLVYMPSAWQVKQGFLVKVSCAGVRGRQERGQTGNNEEHLFGGGGAFTAIFSVPEVFHRR